MREVKAFNEQRAEIYWWFSGLFTKKLTDKELDTYHSIEFRRFLAGLGENKSLKRSVGKLTNVLNRLQDREKAQFELAADFDNLFLTNEKSAAPPYASVYADEYDLLNNNPAEEMQRLMAEFGVQVDTKLNQAADHLAIELDFLASMIIRSNELEQEKHIEEAFLKQNSFIDNQLLSWLPKFSEKCLQLDKFGFYACVTQLLIAFCQLDRAYLLNE